MSSNPQSEKPKKSFSCGLDKKTTWYLYQVVFFTYMNLKPGEFLCLRLRRWIRNIGKIMNFCFPMTRMDIIRLRSIIGILSWCSIPIQRLRIKHLQIIYLANGWKTQSRLARFTIIA